MTTPAPGSGSSYAPTGKAVVTDGGYTLSGKWSFSSGCDHCSWVLLGGLVFNAEGNVVDFKTFMVPRGDYTIVDVWNVVGLSGTGSNDIVVDDVFVPEAFTLSMGDTGRCFGPGQSRTRPTSGCRSTRSSPARSPRRSSAWRWVRTPSTWTCSRSGCARRTWGEGVPGPLRAVRIAGVVGDRRRVGAAGQQHPGGAGLRRAGGRSRRCGSGAARPGPGDPARDRRDRRPLRGVGGRALATGTYLQRAWRDAHAGRVHAANDPERALQMFGAHEFGHKVDPGMY